MFISLAQWGADAGKLFLFLTKIPVDGQIQGAYARGRSVPAGS